MKTPHIPLDMRIAMNRAALAKVKRDAWRQIRAAGAYNIGEGHEVKPLLSRNEMLAVAAGVVIVVPPWVFGVISGASFLWGLLP